MKIAAETKIDHSIATYISGGVYVQVAEGLSTEFLTDLSKNGRYTKNVLEKSIASVEKIIKPISTILNEKQREISAIEISKLVDLMSDIAGLSDEEYKRVNNIIDKIKADRKTKLLKSKVA